MWIENKWSIVTFTMIKSWSFEYKDLEKAGVLDFTIIRMVVLCFGWYIFIICIREQSAIQINRFYNSLSLLSAVFAFFQIRNFKEQVAGIIINTLVATHTAFYFYSCYKQLSISDCYRYFNGYHWLWKWFGAVVDVR
jgi:hypothetical protein